MSLRKRWHDFYWGDDPFGRVTVARGRQAAHAVFWRELADAQGASNPAALSEEVGALYGDTVMNQSSAEDIVAFMQERIEQGA